MAQRVGQGDGDDRTLGGEIDLRALGRGVWRRKLWILLPTLVVALAAFAFVQISSPMFRSSALVLIENRESFSPRAGDRETPLPDDQAVATQVQFIQSRDLVRSVVKALDLGKDPEFGGARESLPRRLLRMIGLGGAKDDQPFNERVVDKVSQNLVVYPIQGSRVVGLEFVSNNPDTAARIVNGFVDAYLEIQRDSKRAQNRQATQYLSDEIAGLRTRVGEAEDRVEAFRSKAGLLVGSNNTTVAAQQLGEAANQLSASKSQRGEAQAKADTIRTLLRQGRPADALDIANSDVVRALAQQRSQLAAQIASEGRTLLPQHPRMRELSAQLQGLDQQVRTEAEKMARGFENEAKTAGARVAALEKQLDDFKTVAAGANAQDVQLRALEREARSQRDLLEQMLARYREAAARDNPEALLADARVISRGAAPSEPYFPKKLPTVLLAALGAFVLSLFWAAAAEVFGGPQSRDEEDATPPPALGEVPVFGRLHGRMGPETRAPAPPPPHARYEPTAAAPQGSAPAEDRPEPSAGAETKEASVAPALPSDVRPTAAPAVAGSAAGVEGRAREATIEVADATLVAALARQLADMPTGDGALRILATGTVPDLAVAAVATKLASHISSSGRRVVMVDAGGGTAQDAAQPGLAELLSGDATFSQAIHRDAGSRVHLVPAGRERFERLDAAARGRLAIVLDALALTYDFVMLVTPSGPGGSEPFARHCQAAVLVSAVGASDVATIEAHERVRKAGIEDVVVLLVGGAGDRGGPRGRSLAA
ncbi:GumC family protein [Hansschlegelia sp. KR7-227]|uniref:GumC family protein n=1 Tax=Hansschlegelia sp. KR7-227 TaxID=3400914 RepID=UPI003C1077C9